MVFHAAWRQQRAIATIGGTGTMDWNYISLSGTGVFVGDTLSVVNHARAWWGEGDEKIYIDGEAFPSHFGTGTEDYYGYAWCSPRFFDSAFHAQPRAEGPSNFGNTTNSRVRLLDAIPFARSLQLDMEVWHWKSTTIDYAVATYWYARPGASSNAPSVDKNIAEAKAEVVYDMRYQANIPGFDIANEPAGNLRIQKMTNFGEGWHDNNHLWWTDATPGDVLAMNIEAPATGKLKLVGELTKAPDYAIVQFLVDGKPVGEPVDLYNDRVVPTGEMTLGTVELAKGTHRLEVKIVGKNEKAMAKHLVGIDTIRLVPVGQ
jgi:hypothetical protein